MSEFRSMTITVAKDVTENGGYFHEITVEDGHNSDTLLNVLNACDDRGYEIVSVFIDGYDFIEEMWHKIGHISNLVLLFETLCNDIQQAGVICAFIQENDCADVDSWHEHIYIEGMTHEQIVREWVEVFHKIYRENSKSYYESDYVETETFPSWMVIDWEETLKEIAEQESSSVVAFAGNLYFFG